jgi:hypothetical protein
VTGAQEEQADEDEGARLVECASHGQAYATYICKHLVSKPKQRWFADLPEEDWPWPDAWCTKCQAIFERQGGWPEDGEEAPIALVCNHCYQDKRAESAESFSGKAGSAWKALIRDAMNELEDKQAALSEEFEISRHKRYDWSQETGELVFSNDGVPAVIASFEFIGTLSSKSGTWLWSWANFSFQEAMRTAALKLHEVGEEHDFRKLTTPKWNASEHDAWEMAALAAKLLDLPGVYKSPSENGASFLMIKDIRKASREH